MAIQAKKIVMVFGVFDGIHDGHRNLFEQARKYGDELVAVVCRDEMTTQLKGKLPKFSESERVATLKKDALIANAVLGDEYLSSYNILFQLKPNAICLGYDQQTLADDIVPWLKQQKLDIQVIRLKPYQPEMLHSSLLNQGWFGF
ncbi:MAG: hypothetical protein A2748_01435 [Candidatus Wildermuthbacteria bacterium RIFCSPHIGHO2_01_FULL_45_20]|uniref:Cytidyltransferase-like domain-containing protein n=1 Tax=Candidatus Wildermuthbacteria bacterium RIFCSPHIGHO2_02_FULL_45_25 TaxID=1802450 RepID=A0A1G2R0P1_9BACT|nr:MAG: hypothetical protein A2748_01435 [Candidatus Wildermuthbacteria bacterium RIFCSPHIGHO2_01_FULL_45_20]OHA65651.1 MAG: hypothetical protein A3C04_01625 [Candidatus Wildermuthbacteria bacterium RIFCSPHIGHO2_02_FULL_45_25]